MNDLTTKLTGEFIPTKAVIVYEWDGEYYLEQHKISKGQMLAGKPLTEEMLHDLAEALDKKKRKDSTIIGIVPSNLLYCHWAAEKKVLVWYEIPVKRQMLFTKDLGIKNGEAWQPGLIFVMTGKELLVFAYVGDQRPCETTQLYRAPYHNVSSEGEVCLGSASISGHFDNTYSSWIMRYQLLFWGSEFSHLAGNDSPIQGNLNAYWMKAIRTGAAFDNSVLIPFSAPTLKELLEDL
jgi:PRTRC genetic system protein B